MEDQMKAMRQKSMRAEDIATAEKEGFFTGRFTVNPFSGQLVPVWVANFVLADFGPAAHRLVRALERKGILVRERRDFPRQGFVRISAGTRADTRRVLRAMEGIL